MRDETGTDQLPKGVVGDRRRAARVPVEVDCQCVTDSDFFMLGERIVDISPDGLLLSANGTPAEVGETVIVSFKPPRSTVWIDAEARVVRLVTGSRPGAPGIGLRLDDLSAFDSALLAGTLERFGVRRRRPKPRVQRPRYVPEGAVSRCSIVSLTGPEPRRTPAGTPDVPVARVLVVG